MVANADQLVIVTALADPPPRPRLIDRFLVAAFDAGLSPLLCLTKADLAPAGRRSSPSTARSAFAHVVPAGRSPRARLDPLREALAAGSACWSGTLAWASRPWSTRWSRGPTGPSATVNPVTGRGRHTSSSAVALPLPPPGERLAHRHAGAAWLRPGPHLPGAGGAGLPRPGPGHPGLPARLHATWSRTAPWTTGSGIRAGTAGWWCGWTRCAACCAAGKATTPADRAPGQAICLGQWPSGGLIR